MSPRIEQFDGHDGGHNDGLDDGQRSHRWRTVEQSARVNTTYSVFIIDISLLSLDGTLVPFIAIRRREPGAMS